VLEDKLLKVIDELWPEIWRTAVYIYQNPELGGQEYKAVGCLKDLLEKYSFSFATPYLELETSLNSEFCLSEISS